MTRTAAWCLVTAALAALVTLAALHVRNTWRDRQGQRERAAHAKRVEMARRFEPGPRPRTGYEAAVEDRQVESDVTPAELARIEAFANGGAA